MYTTRMGTTSSYLVTYYHLGLLAAGFVTYELDGFKWI